MTNKNEKVRMTQLEDSADVRGSSFTPSILWQRLLSNNMDIHLMTLRPGFVRGNHYHRNRFEVLLMVYADAWSLHWDSGPETPTEHHSFSGSGAVMVEIEPLASHAIRNDGACDLQIIGLANIAYEPSSPDAYPRRVV